MVRTVIPDKTSALAAAQAISSALFYREKTNKGQHVKVSMLDVMIAYLWPEGSSTLSFLDNNIDPSEGQFGLDLVYKTKDKYITAGAVTDKEWMGMCNALSRMDLMNDQRFKNARVRFRNANIRREIISQEIIKYKSDEILSKLRKEQVPCAPILKRKELLDNEQVKASKIIQFDESLQYGKFRGPRPAAKFSLSHTRKKRLAPLLGEDTKKILSESGFVESDIEDLIKEKIIFSN